MKRVLIIENEADAAETMRRILEEKGYSAQCAPDPREGLKMLKKFDLLLLDIMMPGMSGMDVLSKIRKMKAGIPVIVVSASSLPWEMERDLKADYPEAGFVSKLRISELPAEVRKRLGGK